MEKFLKTCCSCVNPFNYILWSVQPFRSTWFGFGYVCLVAISFHDLKKFVHMHVPYIRTKCTEHSIPLRFASRSSKILSKRTEWNFKCDAFWTICNHFEWFIMGKKFGFGLPSPWPYINYLSWLFSTYANTRPKWYWQIAYFERCKMNESFLP